MVVTCQCGSRSWNMESPTKQRGSQCDCMSGGTDLLFDVGHVPALLSAQEACSHRWYICRFLVLCCMHGALRLHACILQCGACCTSVSDGTHRCTHCTYVTHLHVVRLRVCCIHVSYAHVHIRTNTRTDFSTYSMYASVLCWCCICVAYVVSNPGASVLVRLLQT